ncbi:MAG: iron-sulfur cluster assembly accessory protein [Myxococcota bacterium]
MTQHTASLAPADTSGTRLSCEDFPVQLTATAIRMAQAALQETQGEDGSFFRISIRGGGCAGFQYGLNFDDMIDDTDLWMQQDGLTVVMDLFSSCHLRGATIDYTDSLQEGSGFRFDHPGARRTCGCGSSFGV